MPLIDLPPDAQLDPLPGTLTDLPPGAQPDSWGQSISEFGQNMATGILKGVGQLGGLPHSVAQLGDVGMDLFATPRNNLADLAAGQPPASSSASAPTPMMAPGPGWLTRHTYSPEDINSGIFGGISVLNQATGGQPVAPYQPTTTGGKVFQSGMEQVIPSLLGPAETAGSRLIGGTAGGAAQKAYEIARPDDMTGQLVTGLLTAPLTSLAATGVGRAATGTYRILANRFGSDDRRALYGIGRSLAADVDAGGPTPTNIANAMWNSNTTPLTPLDAGGFNLQQGSGGRALRTPDSAASNLITGSLDTRDRGVFQRLTDLTNTLVPGGSTYRTGEAITDAQRAAAGPAYTAFESAAPVNPDHIAPGGALNRLLQRPVIRRAMGAAIDGARNQGMDPASMGLGLNAAGEPIFQSVPSWRTLDYIKQNLDDQLEPFRNPITRRLENTTQGARDTRSAVTAFQDFMDANNDLYAPARQAYSGPAGSRNALQAGAGAFHPSAPSLDELGDQLAEMTPGDLQLFRLGAKNELQNQMGGMGVNANEARTFIGNPNRQARIRTIFGDNADTFLNAAQTEDTAFGTRFRLTGGSPTAGRVAQDTPAGSELMDRIMPFATGVGSMIAGEPTYGLSQVGRGVANLLGNGRMTPGVAEQTARYLLETNPQEAHNILSRAYQTYRPLPGPPVSGAIPTVPMVGGLLNQ